MSEFTFAAVSFTQNEEKLYFAAPDMETLIKVCKIDKWNPEIKEESLPDINEFLKKQGYQRIPKTLRKRKLAQYLIKQDSILPNSILLSKRDEIIDFRPTGTNNSVGTITLKGDDVLYIIDGQHRFEGIKYAIEELELQDLLDFNVPIVIINSKTKIREIEQFVLLNRTQKKVKTDLGDRLLELLKRTGKIDGTLSGLEQKDWKSRAVRLTKRLNDDKSSPWRNNIIQPNAMRTTSNIAGESEFSKSLKNILLSVYGEKFTEEDDQVYEYICNTWWALRKLMPECFDTPSEYVIQKTVGFHSWNQVLPVIIRECKDEYGRGCSVENISKIIQKVKEADDYDFLSATWWESGNKVGASAFVGMGPINTLAKAMIEFLEQ